MKRLLSTLLSVTFFPLLYAQVGIGISTPQAQLHVAQGSVIFTSSGDVASSPTSTALGTSRRMLWYADKAAFRVGYTTPSSTSMHIDSIGNYSASLGRNNKVKGYASFAAGSSHDVRGDYASALGEQCDAVGLNSFAAGKQARAMGDYSVAMGNNTDATGQYSSAFGYLTNAEGNFSTALGQGNRAQGANCLASGFQLIARGFGSTVVGTYNQPIMGGDGENSLNYSTPLFIVGNGTAQSDRSNALVVRRWGAVGIGTDDPAGRLHVVGGTDASMAEMSGYLVVGQTFSTNIVIDNNEIMARNDGVNSTLYLQNSGGDLQTGGTASKPGGGSWTATSDARLKQDIQPFKDGLLQLLKIKPVYYHYNRESGYDTQKQHIGVIAQDLQQIAPYMVGSFKKEGVEYLNVDNTAMTYMLINAVKEQQKEIEALKEMVKELQEK